MHPGILSFQRMGTKSNTPEGSFKTGPISFDDFELFHDMPEGGSLTGSTEETPVSQPCSPSDAVSDILEGIGRGHTATLMKNSSYNRSPKLDRSLTPVTASEIRAKHPHFIQPLTDAWGIPELFHLQMNRLFVVDKQRVARQGYSDGVKAEITALINNHDRLFGLPPTRFSPDPFDTAGN